MHSWTASDWALLLTAISTLLVGLTTMAVTIINATKGISSKVDGVEAKVGAVKDHVSKLEVKVDGGLKQLLRQTHLASRAEGVEAGRGEMVVSATAPSPMSQPTPLPDPGEISTLVGPNEEPLVIPIPVDVPTTVIIPHEKKK